MKKIIAVFLACAFVMGSSIACEAAGYGTQLTPDQMEAARRIFEETYSGMDSTRQALSAKRAELDAQLASPNPDRAKIESLSREIGELRGKMLGARASVRDQLARQGLPTDFFAPDRSRGYQDDDYDYDAPRRWHGPRWHHGPRGGHHYGGGYGWNCGGCW